ncbi:MAG: ABC transporter [Hirschia sp.]|nr:ABC transporter [Hirschia sp.]MBF19442.1 ABC transporter [Hirschia sp.]
MDNRSDQYALHTNASELPVEADAAPASNVSVLGDVVNGMASWRLWSHMALRDIQMRYRRSLIGPFWLSINLLVLVLSLGLLYSQIFRVDYQDYLIYLCLGLVVWQLLSTIITEACSILIENETQLRSLPLSVTTLSSRMVMRNLMVLGHNAVVVIGLLVVFKAPLSLNSLMALPGIALLTLVGVCLGLIMGPLCLRFRDVPQVVASVLQIGFFLSPILWSTSQLPNRMAIVEFNPIYHLVEIVRAPLLNETVSLQTWIVVGVILIFLMIGSVISLGLSKKNIYYWL